MDLFPIRPGATVALALALMAGGAGCESPQPQRQHPPGTLRIPYERADSHTGCLTASVAMVANYVLGEYRFSEKRLRHALERADLDETDPADVKNYLESVGLHLAIFRGELDGKPPLGLEYWVLQRGYPAICVINTHGGDPNLNHAVVVIGFSRTDAPESADTIYYLDPATADPLQKMPADEFERAWARAGHTMMVVVRPPAGEGQPAESQGEGHARCFTADWDSLCRTDGDGTRTGCG